MQLYCQGCQAAYAAASHCPRCGSRLLAPQESHLNAGLRRKPPPEPIATSFANRLFVGGLFAIGLCFAIRELFFSVGLHPAFTGLDLWNEANTQPTTFAIRLIAVVGGGLLAGAGRRQGLQVGAAVGLIVGGLLTAFDVFKVGQLNDLAGVLMAIAYPIAAGISGMFGSAFWPPDVLLPEPTHQSSRGSSLARLAVEDEERRRERPLAWFRIVLASVLVVVVATTTDPIRTALAKNSGGWLNTNGPSKSGIIGLELTALAAILAGLIAGASTGAGLQHGFLAGLLASAGLLLGANRQPEGLHPAVAGFLKLFEMEREPLTSANVAGVVLPCLIVLMSFAGSVGGTLFPPLAPEHLRKRIMTRQT